MSTAVSGLDAGVRKMVNEREIKRLCAAIERAEAKRASACRGGRTGDATYWAGRIATLQGLLDKVTP